MNVLICHDGELADICGMLRALGRDFSERLGPPSLAELTRSFDVVVATPARALRLARLLERPETRSIVVAEAGTRSAGRRLHMIGVEWIVRRPVHPAALRLLLQHVLYRGPERRRSGRVSVGLEVRYRAGLMPHRGVLREVSLRGASLIARRRVPPGRRIALRVPDGGGLLVLRGEVLRCRPVAPGQLELGIALDPHPRNPLQSLRRLVEHYAQGPASCAAASLAPAESAPGRLASLTDGREQRPRDAGACEADARESARRDSDRASDRLDGNHEADRRAPERREAEADRRAAERREAEADRCAAERREADRRAFGRRVIAVGEAAPRVLVGRDLSLGGMRVEADSSLTPGQRLKLALHANAGETPLVLEAEVLRSDASGSGLRFAALGEPSRRYLAKILDSLPELAAPNAIGEEERRILAEVVEG